jgi:hypothetical protein
MTFCILLYNILNDFKFFIAFHSNKSYDFTIPYSGKYLLIYIKLQ